jgi:hypothetical protein
MPAVGLGDRECLIGEYVEPNVALWEKETCETRTVVSDQRGVIGIDYMLNVGSICADVGCQNENRVRSRRALS